MSNTADVFEESINDISFIEKAKHSCNDLEDSINQCVVLFAKSMELTEPVRFAFFCVP